MIRYYCELRNTDELHSGFTPKSHKRINMVIPNHVSVLGGEVLHLPPEVAGVPAGHHSAGVCVTLDCVGVVFIKGNKEDPSHREEEVLHHGRTESGRVAFRGRFYSQDKRMMFYRRKDTDEDSLKDSSLKNIPECVFYKDQCPPPPSYE